MRKKEKVSINKQMNVERIYGNNKSNGELTNEDERMGRRKEGKTESL